MVGIVCVDVKDVERQDVIRLYLKSIPENVSLVVLAFMHFL